jgi:DeoR/GlpR family transcriptional regulator of sugar metabolism
MTVWRDLRAIEDSGLVRRVRGGAVHIQLSGSEPRFEAKRSINFHEKQRIARYAAEHFVDDGMILVLEAGTTVAGMVPYLYHSRLTILTNGLNVLTEAARELPRLTVLGSGGLLRENSLTFVGPEADAFFTHYRADVFFLSATGLTIEDGLTDPSPLEIEIKRVMGQSAHKRILLLDSGKFAIRSLANVMPLSEIDVVVTDSGASQMHLDWLQGLEIDVRVV